MSASLCDCLLFSSIEYQLRQSTSSCTRSPKQVPSYYYFFIFQKVFKDLWARILGCAQTLEYLTYRIGRELLAFDGLLTQNLLCRCPCRV